MSTPVVAIVLRGQEVLLKLEGANPFGSVKDRTAVSLVDDLERRGALRPEDVLVESTSGNLGVALASIARARGYRFVAVVDPKATGENIARMIALGASVERVTTPDETGCYLAARLQRVAELRAGSDAVVWPDQYANPAGPRAHEHGTGPELLGQVANGIDAVFIPVSTGGTLAGVARCLRRESPATRIVAVDAAGSVALGGRPGPRLLTGVGAGRRSRFLPAGTDLYDECILVTDREAFAHSRALAAATGIGVGGSSGAAIAACGRALAADRDLGRAVCLCPDRAESYASTFFDDRWLARHGIDPRSLTAPIVASRRRAA